MKSPTIRGVPLIVLSAGLHTTAVVLAAVGEINTVAGTGPHRILGRRGPIASAKLNGPNTVAVHSLGNLFVDDQSNRRIRRADLVAAAVSVPGVGTRGLTGLTGAALLMTRRRPARQV